MYRSAEHFDAQPRRATPINATRFGEGYWIGAIGSTVIGLSLLLLDCLAGHIGKIHPLITLVLGFLAATLVVIMLVGSVMSASHFQKGLRSRDRNNLIGGSIGFLLCVWPSAFLVVIFVWAICTLPA